MSTDRDEELTAAGVPELTPLGRRIEHLRLERRMSKRILAQRAGTSRQQLWRVMTGKSDLTSSLCARVAEVLEVDSRWLRDTGATTYSDVHGDNGVQRGNGTGHAPSPDAKPVLAGADARLCQTLEEYISASSGLERTFETLPMTDDGRRLKRVLLDAIEDIAIDRSIRLPQAIFDLRRAVVNDDG
jgi:transcriptional regulator with XRE-family HTH domain